MTGRLLSFSAFAAVALFGGLSSTAQAADNLVGRTQVFPAYPSLSAAPAPNTAASGFYIPSITAGYAASGVPCFECSPAGSIAIPYPSSVITNGSAYSVSVLFQSVSYVGYPIVYASIFQAGTRIGGGYTIFTSPFGAGYVGYAVFDGTLPTTTGPVTVVTDVVDLASKTSIAAGVGVFTVN